MGEIDILDSVVDSGFTSSPDPVPSPDLSSPAEPLPVPEPVPDVPAEPLPVPEPDPVEPVSPPSMGDTPPDSFGDMVSPGTDSSIGEQLPGEELPGDQSQVIVQPSQPVVDFWANYQLSQSQLSNELELVNVETYQLSPITSSTGLKGVLLDVLGPYDNIVTQYKYQQGNNSYYTYVNEVTPDYPWIASAALFIALLVSLFGLLKRGMSWMK